METKTRQELQAECDAFNAKYQVGEYVWVKASNEAYKDCCVPIKKEAEIVGCDVMVLLMHGFGYVLIDSILKSGGMHYEYPVTKNENTAKPPRHTAKSVADMLNELEAMP